MRRERLYPDLNKVSGLRLVLRQLNNKHPRANERRMENSEVSKLQHSLQAAKASGGQLDSMHGSIRGASQPRKRIHGAKQQELPQVPRRAATVPQQVPKGDAGERQCLKSIDREKH